MLSNPHGFQNISFWFTYFEREHGAHLILYPRRGTKLRHHHPRQGQGQRKVTNLVEASVLLFSEIAKHHYKRRRRRRFMSLLEEEDLDVHLKHLKYL